VLCTDGRGELVLERVVLRAEDVLAARQHVVHRPTEVGLQGTETAAEVVEGNVGHERPPFCST
jgi:hypothetical protein